MHKLVGAASAQRAVVDSPFAAGQKNIWTQIMDANKKEAKEKGGARREGAVVPPSAHTPTSARSSRQRKMCSKEACTPMLLSPSVFQI